MHSLHEQHTGASEVPPANPQDLYRQYDTHLSQVITELGSSDETVASENLKQQLAEAALDFDTRFRNQPGVAPELRAPLLVGVATILEYLGKDDEAENCQHLLDELFPETQP